MESTGWTWLPYEGSFLDQPDWLLHDLMTISWRKGIVNEMLSPTPKEMTK